MTYTLARSKHSTFGYGTISISLPQMPFDVPPAVTDETAPRLLPVRGTRIKAKLSHAAQERAFDRAADALAAKIAGLGVLAQVVL